MLDHSPSRTGGPPSPRLVIPLAAGAAFLAMLDATVANLAVPDLRADFTTATMNSLTWVITLYAVLFAALLAPAGRLADLIGRRALFQAGVGLFTLMSLACALAPTLPALLVARGFQGAAAAAMIPASLAVLLHDTPAERRAGAIGLWSAAAALAAAVGPGVGGILVEGLGWRSLFLINVPIGLALIITAARLPGGTGRPADGSRRLPDLLGTALLGGGLGAVALGIAQGPDWGWTSTATLGSLAGGALMVALALARSARHPVPAVEISLWRNRSFTIANLASALYGAALLPWMLVGVLVLVDLWHYTPLEAGLAMMPGAVTATLSAVLAGRLIGRFGVRPALAGGALVIAASGVWSAAALTAEPRFLTFWLPVGMLVGAGIGAVGTGTASAAALSVSPLRFAGATGLNTTARQLGGTLGLAVLAALLPEDPATGDYTAVYLFCALIALGAAAAGAALTVRPAAPVQTVPKEKADR